MTTKKKHDLIALFIFIGLIYFFKWWLGFEAMIMIVMVAVFATYLETNK